MRGGMRINAGRPRTKSQTGQLHSLDARRLRREDLLRPGLRFGWQWTDEDGKPTARIDVRTHERALTVEYSINGTPVEQRVELLETPCNYGGDRVWLACPNCRQRVAPLYLSRQVACRKCFRLAYPSQSEDLMGRMWRKQGKVERRLRSGKRMTSATRDRLIDELMRVEDAREAAFIAAARRLLGL
ncbi:hypothetical protein AWB75_07138 [Caballeronia catudaia]|uniref:Uncharacterized protein n=1 Tax=Caballeronia catudaia TaxID=1777136 RepID=A0A158DSL2_9BURK|nr:hypothetical protein [Caballeronia catudaia]SAK97649.1 hypothetical protein AWB75_07138 [Caballeronia catudaia]